MFFEVCLDGSVGFTPHEAFTCVLMEGDSDIRVHVTGEFVTVSSETGTKRRWKQACKHGIHKHGGGHE